MRIATRNASFTEKRHKAKYRKKRAVLIGLIMILQQTLGEPMILWGDRVV
jgi:hypothetical protein